MSDEREDLENLTRTNGWILLQQYAQTEFADKLMAHAEQAANLGDEKALSLLRQLIAGKRAVEVVMQYPKERLRQLNELREKEAQGPGLRRGGA